MLVAQNKEVTLRRWQIADAPAAFLFYGDPEVSRLIGNGKPVADIAQTERVLAKFIAHEQEFGFSPWAMCEGSTEEVIGICGLHTFNEHKEIELGYRLRKAFWGRGLTTAASFLTLGYAINTLRAKKMIAHTTPANVGSQKVLTKVGFSEAGRFIEEESKQQLIRYEITLSIR